MTVYVILFWFFPHKQLDNHQL